MTDDLKQKPYPLVPTPEDLRKMWELWEKFRVMNEAMLDRVTEERVITATMVRAMEGAK